MQNLQSIWKGIPQHIVKQIQYSIKDPEQNLQEIRLRRDKPLLLRHMKGIQYVKDVTGKCYIVTGSDIKACISLLSGYSLYAFEDELRQGFLTISGGHRIGFCGKAVIEDGKIRTLNQISSLNIRIAREVFGCADEILPYLFEHGAFCHTLLLSPPGCGKTTILRELIRCLANAPYHYTVGVADERGEIAGMFDGAPQMDLGECSDVISGCPKAAGMELLLRSMSPDIIAADELGREEDFFSAVDTIHAGVKLLCTVHGSCLQEVQKRPFVKKLLEMGAIERFVFLSKKHGVGNVQQILDRNGNCIYQGRECHSNDEAVGDSMHIDGKCSDRHFFVPA